MSASISASESLAKAQLSLYRWEREGGGWREDFLVEEAPLELFLNGEPFVTLLRSPGKDRSLCAGHLWSEGVIEERADLRGLFPCPIAPERRWYAQLADRVPLPRRERQSVSSSSCGLCGLVSASALNRRWRERPEPFLLSHSEAYQLTEALRATQPLFRETGGAHGCARFNEAGQLMGSTAEDLGRHNAFDKALGELLLSDGHVDLPAPFGLVTSSRVSSELVQKALVVGASALVAVGAASALAHRFAAEAGLPLYSFIRAYSGNRHPLERR